MLLYCDSVIIIYMVEGNAANQLRPGSRLQSAWTAGDAIAVSDLVRLECRVKPLAADDRATLAEYDGLFRRAQVVPIDVTVFDLATAIKGRFRYRLADSLHLAAAIGAGCERF
ncbi:MAG: type II toxin-antitoxin system VapC family toxin [Planctomycetota bacterium]